MLAPKGFFDDLPQPAKKSGAGIDLPAPKGFFDDLPQPAQSAKPTVDLPAPKGFFDDLPQPAKAPAPGGGGGGGGGGFFDDLPQPAKPATAPKGIGAKAGAAAPGSLFDDLAPPSGKGNEFSIGNDIELGGGGDDRALELDLGGGAGPELDLGLPLGQDASFSDIDISAPSTPGAKPIAPPGEDPEGSPIKIKTPKGGKPATPIPITVKPKEGAGDLKLDLADDPHAGKAGAAAATTGGKASPKRKAAASPEEIAEERARKRKRTRIMLASVLAVVGLGTGGFLFYQKHTAKQERAEKIQAGLDAARKALVDDKPKHWQTAETAASDVLEIDTKNATALALQGEAMIAGALDNGVTTTLASRPGARRSRKRSASARRHPRSSARRP
jgi:hypothetical protein